MKPFKFLSTPFEQHEIDSYEEGYQEASQDIESQMWYNWAHRCPYSVGTREYEMWGLGYRDRFHLHHTGTPRL